MSNRPSTSSLQEIQRDLDAGNLANIYVRDDESAGGPDIPMSEVHARHQQQGVHDHPAAAHPTADEGPISLQASRVAAQSRLSTPHQNQQQQQQQTLKVRVMA